MKEIGRGKEKVKERNWKTAGRKSRDEDKIKKEQRKRNISDKVR